MGTATTVNHRAYKVTVMDQIICSAAIVMRRRYRDVVRAAFEELRLAENARR
jgi:gluconate kinase